MDVTNPQYTSSGALIQTAIQSLMADAFDPSNLDATFWASAIGFGKDWLTAKGGSEAEINSAIAANYGRAVIDMGPTGLVAKGDKSFRIPISGDLGDGGYVGDAWIKGLGVGLDNYVVDGFFNYFAYVISKSTGPTNDWFSYKYNGNDPAGLALNPRYSIAMRRKMARDMDAIITSALYGGHDFINCSPKVSENIGTGTYYIHHPNIVKAVASGGTSPDCNGLFTDVGTWGYTKQDSDITGTVASTLSAPTLPHLDAMTNGLIRRNNMRPCIMINGIPCYIWIVNPAIYQVIKSINSTLITSLNSTRGEKDARNSMLNGGNGLLYDNLWIVPNNIISRYITSDTGVFGGSDYFNGWYSKTTRTAFNTSYYGAMTWLLGAEAIKLYLPFDQISYAADNDNFDRWKELVYQFQVGARRSEFSSEDNYATLNTTGNTSLTSAYSSSSGYQIRNSSSIGIIMAS